MKILAFDTTMSACSVAILNENRRIVLQKIAPKQQAQLILAMIDQALAEAELSLSELDAIAYSCGPGSFTGLRIASSVAQGLAFPHQTPVVQISSLAALAQSAFEEHGTQHFLVAVDARMNQVYWGEYHVNEKGLVELLGEENVYTPAELDFKTEENYLAVGDGWKIYEQLLFKQITTPPTTILPDQVVSPNAILTLAIAKFKANGGIPAQEALPVYLR